MPTSKATNPDRRTFLLRSLAAGATTALPLEIHAANAASSPQQDRSYWLQQVELVSEPVLKALKEGNLRRKMPIEAAPVLSYNNQLLTSVAATSTHDYTVVFLGTVTGHLKKVCISISLIRDYILITTNASNRFTSFTFIKRLFFQLLKCISILTDSRIYKKQFFGALIGVVYNFSKYCYKHHYKKQFF